MDYNNELFYFINRKLENSIFNFIMPSITDLGGFVALLIILIIIIVYTHIKNNSVLKKIAFITLIAFLFTDLIVLFLKNFFKEPRPFITLKNVHLLIVENDHNSLPSGHAASTLSVVTVLILNMKKLFKKHYKLINIALIIFAVVIPFSRIYVGVHYPIDVFSGAIIGVGIAWMVNYINKSLNIINF